MTTDTLKARRQELLDTMPDPTNVMRASLITRSIKAASLTADVPMERGTKACTSLPIMTGRHAWISYPRLIKTLSPNVLRIMRISQPCL